MRGNRQCRRGRRDLLKSNSGAGIFCRRAISPPSLRDTLSEGGKFGFFKCHYVWKYLSPPPPLNNHMYYCWNPYLCVVFVTLVKYCHRWSRLKLQMWITLPVWCCAALGVRLSVLELGGRQFPNTVIFTPSAICFNAYIESLLVGSRWRINLDGKAHDFSVSSQWALLLKQVRHELTCCLVPTFRVSFDKPATEQETFFIRHVSE